MSICPGYGKDHGYGTIRCDECDPQGTPTEKPYREELPLRDRISLKQQCIAVVAGAVSEQNRSLDRVLFGAEFLYEWLIGEKKAADMPAYVPPKENLL